LIWAYSTDNKNDRDIITYGSSLLAGVVGIITLLYTADSIRRSNQEKRAAAASRFLERWNNPAYLGLKSRWRKLNEEIEVLSPEARFNLLNGDTVKRTTAVEVLNFFEEVAGSVNNNSVDEDLLKRFFRTILVRYYRDYEYWIEQHKKVRGAFDFCDELKTLALKWEKAKD
jgi:hypothetical protein